MSEIRLTQTVKCGGCAAKLNPVDLYSVLAKLPSNNFGNLLIGFETGDDACVYSLNEDNALIFTTDFIAPLVDSPFDFGRIAAANALSDVYAMGGKPILALNIVCFDESLGNSVLEEMLLGGAEACNIAGAILCGGHTVRSDEIRYGLAVIGQVNPNRIIANSNGRAGDTLFLTKPLGSGILCQAIKYDLLPHDLAKILTDQLCELNDKVADVMQEVGVKCATDVTGFGLAGHLHKLVVASNCGAEIYLDSLPYLPFSIELASDNIHSGNLKKNKEYVLGYLEGDFVENAKSKLLFDPQTSGGLLISVNPLLVADFRAVMARQGLVCFEIGNLNDSKSNIISIK